MLPPRVTEFPLVKGSIKSAKGALGAFEVTIDDYAQPSPSSRGGLQFGPARNDVATRCDLLIDLYRRARRCFPPPICATAICAPIPATRPRCCARVLKARDLTGSSTSRATSISAAELCAHSRSGIVGCRRCLDLCPTGAIAPAGDVVAIDATICAGCGQCAAACPTGAAGLRAAAGRRAAAQAARAAVDLSRRRRRAAGAAVP